MKEAVTGVAGKRIFTDHWVYIDSWIQIEPFSKFSIFF
jgi:hypothetical protein